MLDRLGCLVGQPSPLFVSRSIPAGRPDHPDRKNVGVGFVSASDDGSVMAPPRRFPSVNATHRKNLCPSLTPPR